MSAPTGKVKHNGTTISGNDVVIEAMNYEYKPVYTEDIFSEHYKKRSTRVETRTPKQGGIISTGRIIFKTKNATLVGATIVAPKISNPTSGTFRFLPAYIDQHVWSYEKKSRFFGSTSIEFTQDRHIPIGCQILANEFEFLGSGTLEMEGVIAKIINAAITKNIKERSAYETNHTVITQKSSGFCPPKINGDAFVNSIKNATSGFTCFTDAAATTFNLISGTFKTFSDLETLANLSTLPNPGLAVLNIFLSRYVSAFTFCSTKTVTTVDEKTPHQSQIDIEELKVSNDRIHLEGIWNVKDKATIETKEFKTQAPEHTLHQTTKTTGFSISLSPVSIVTACIAPHVKAAIGLLPSINVFSSSSDIRSKDYKQQVLTADDLFIRCDNAVFSGSKIEARLVETIVSGDLTIEDMMSEFSEVKTSKNIGVSLSGIFNLIHSLTPKSQELNAMRNEVKEYAYQHGFAQRGLLKDSIFLDPRWGAIPTIRIANETEIKKSVQNLSSFIGKEKFFLHVANLLHTKNALVGIVPPDGVVANSEKEKIEAGRVLNEKIKETYHHETHVINPCVAEFVQMMSAYQSWQQVREDIEMRKYQKNLNEQKCVRDAKMDAKIQTKNLLAMIDSAEKDELKAILKLMIISVKTAYDKNQPNNEKEEDKNQKEKKSGSYNKQKNSPREKKNDTKNKQKNSPKEKENDSDNKQEKENDDNNEKPTEYDEKIANNPLTKKLLAYMSGTDARTLVEKLYDLCSDDFIDGRPNMITEEVLQEVIEDMKTDGIDQKTNNNNASNTKEYEGWDYVIYHATNAIIKVRNFIDNHMTEINLVRRGIKVILFILKIVNPAYGIVGVCKDFIKGLTSKKNIKKELINQIGFLLSDKYESIMRDFAIKMTDDKDLQSQFVKASKDLVYIGKFIYDLKDDFNDVKDIKVQYNATKNMSFKQKVKRLNPIDNVLDSYADEEFFNNLNPGPIPKSHKMYMDDSLDYKYKYKHQEPHLKSNLDGSSSQHDDCDFKSAKASKSVQLNATKYFDKRHADDVNFSYEKMSDGVDFHKGNSDYKFIDPYDTTTDVSFTYRSGVGKKIDNAAFSQPVTIPPREQPTTLKDLMAQTNDADLFKVKPDLSYNKAKTNLPSKNPTGLQRKFENAAFSKPVTIPPNEQPTKLRDLKAYAQENDADLFKVKPDLSYNKEKTDLPSKHVTDFNRKVENIAFSKPV